MCKLECFNIPIFCKDLYESGCIKHGVCEGIVINNKLLEKCITCNDMNKEAQYYIEDQICCSCEHFHWGMGQMGVCDLREYKSLNDIGEWSDKCSIGKYEYKKP